jgi:uncharacterized caspase-like protein
LTLVLGLSAFTHFPATARSAEEVGETWALLIGVSKYDEPGMNLPFAGADVKRLHETLEKRADLVYVNIREMTHESEARFRPTRANLRREIPAFLKQVQRQDRLIVFFSGHGVMSGDRAYLMTSDARTARVSETALAVEDLRDALKNCPARSKFLILDCCHSGAKFGVRRLTGEGFGPVLDLKKLPGVVVLASCKEDEASFEWAERRQSLFTYWLCRALEGGADSNGKGELTADAVYKYVHERVTETADKLLGVKQTPVRFIGGDVAGTPVVLTLQPEPPETLCRRLAEHLDVEVRGQKLKKVGVLEFLMPLGNAEGLASVPLPAWCAAKVRAQLGTLAQGIYTVLDEAGTREAAKSLRLGDIGNPDAMKRLGVEALVTGTLKQRGQAVHLQCELVRVRDGESLVKPGGVLPLDTRLLADLGRGGDHRPPDVEPRPRPNVRPPAHPLLDPKFPYRVEVQSLDIKPGEEVTKKTRRTARKLVEWKNPATGETEWVIGARPGEVFEIAVVNRDEKRVGLSLLIDGLNTLGLKRERVGEGRLWILDGKSSYKVDGWYEEKETRSRGDRQTHTMHRFKFVDLPDSEAGRQGFTESIGLITAAFFGEEPLAMGAPDLGVGRWRPENREVTVTKFKRGELLGVVQIRYVNEKYLKP